MKLDFMDFDLCKTSRDAERLIHHLRMIHPTETILDTQARVIRENAPKANIFSYGVSTYLGLLNQEFEELATGLE